MLVLCTFNHFFSKRFNSSLQGYECNWDQEYTSQRPVTKQLVQGLRMRVRELESELTRLQAGPINDSGERTNQENGSKPLVAPGTTMNETKEDFPRRSHLTMREGSISASGPTSMWSTFVGEPAPLRENEMPQPGLIYRYVFERAPLIPLYMQSRDIQISEQCEWDRYLPKLNAGIGFTRLEHDTLLHRCFNYHTLWLRTLEPDLFLRDMLRALIPNPDGPDSTKSGRSLTYYSPFLHCALMALATTFSGDLRVRSKHVREQFAGHAKHLLEGECERPAFTAIHGLVFLSEYHGSLGERGLAYLYFGMFDMYVQDELAEILRRYELQDVGLCINGIGMLERKMITRQELASRTWLFWALFCQDKLMSLEYGRDYDISLPHLDVNLPTVDPIRDQQTWEGMQSTGSCGHASQPNQATLVFFQGCRLMLIAIRIMDAVYLQGRQQLGRIENDSIANLHKLLENWFKYLPTQIRVPSQSGEPPLPHVIVLHMAYWWLVMLLHRPYSFCAQPSSSTLDWPPPTAFTDLSVQICERAAKNIVQLVAIFDQAYTCQFLPMNMLQTVFMAGAIILGRYATLPDSPSKQYTDAHTMVQECIRTLRVAAQTWDIAHIYASQLEALLGEQLPQSSFDSYDIGGAYQPSAPEHDDTISRMFRDFITQNDQDAEELGIPLLAIQFQYPLQQLNQQPQLGIPSGSEFVMDPDAPPLSFGSAADKSELAGATEHFPSSGGL
ncbi:unnamed protein product [Rhizoctonia solani]|uniref:Xylanolytic transcriptional activator regulatory domain-containing protein n=1 Tax=Rhizoctonia solani TaxID=456999 RepID=A0A8H3GT33_9AGAM|nr:unnamed protein product [Rhizoctonia solani]